MTEMALLAASDAIIALDVKTLPRVRYPFTVVVR